MWTHEATTTLEDCFECTDWQMLRDATTQENPSSVTSYISQCAYEDNKITRRRGWTDTWGLYPESRKLLFGRWQGSKQTLPERDWKLIQVDISREWHQQHQRYSIWQAIQNTTGYKGSVPSPLLFMLCNHYCNLTTVVKFVYGTTIAGQISNNGET